MNLRKEIIYGVIWGLAIGLLICLAMAAVGNAAAPTDDGANLDISISGDSTKIEIDQDGVTKSIIIFSDSLKRTAQGITVDNELLIEGGKIYIDGVELTEDEINRLSVNKDEESGIAARYGPHQGRHIKRKRLATVYVGSAEDIVKFGDIAIDSNAVVSGDIVSLSGDITIRGQVQGDVVSVFGDVFLEDDALVRGDVAAPFGDVIKSAGAEVRGELAAHKTVKAKNKEVNFGLSARFNRVEGFTFVPGLRFQNEKDNLPDLELGGAYAVTLKRWEYDFAVNHELGKSLGPYFGARLFQVAETPDRWRLLEVENTIAGLLAKEDFYDFYWMRGLSGEAGLHWGDNFRTGLQFTGARISNLKRTAEKAIFGGDKKFRENWSTVLPHSESILASQGDLKELEINTVYDTRDDEVRATTGTYATLQYQQAFDDDTTDFKYKMASGEFKTYIPVAENQTLFVRLRGGYSDDGLPLFRKFFIGGIGSLRGYEFKEFAGNRYMMLNTDYIWYFYQSKLGAGLFADLGKAATGGGAFKDADLKSDLGLCLLVDKALRLDIAQRLDDLDKSPVVMLRGLILF